MSEAATPEPSPIPETPAPERPRRTGKPSLMEDISVAAFGLATSTAVAWVSWWVASHWGFAVYMWMVNWILPFGAILCGLVAATGYWIGARVFNHRPSRTLLFNIVLVSLTTYFMTHHYHYKNDEVADGVRISQVMTFKEYLVARTEHMAYRSYKDPKGKPATQLGKWGWGVAALQVIGFSIGGFIVYNALVSVPFCPHCAKYFGRKRWNRVGWKEVEPMWQAYQDLLALVKEGRVQDAVTEQVKMGNDRWLTGPAMIHVEMRKCPVCELRRLRFQALKKSGSAWGILGDVVVDTQQPVKMD